MCICRHTGHYISNTGLEEAWLEAKWFDSDAVVRQVLECKHMKRAVEALEETMLAVELVQLREMMQTNPTEFLNESEMIFETVENINIALSEHNYESFSHLFTQFEQVLDLNGFRKKFETYRESKSGNFQFNFFTIYTKMVQRLLSFIQASRNGNWLQHLSTGDDSRLYFHGKV